MSNLPNSRNAIDQREDIRVGMSNLAISGNAIEQHEDVRVGISNLAISGNAIDLQQQGVETSQRERVDLHTNVHTGVGTDDDGSRQNLALMVELMEEEERELMEYYNMMHNQGLLPHGPHGMRRHRQRLRRLRN